ncbi:Ldh family oxidoreductase [bacterium]|nr:Ldh family oxidoreductase [bacterium]
MSTTLTVSEAVLRSIIADCLKDFDLPLEEERILTDTLLDANLTGYNSHGVIRLPMFLEGLRAGKYRPGSSPKILQETPVALHIDGSGALGPVTATWAVQQATKRAKEYGIGCVSCCNTRYVARLGGYLSQAADDGYVTLLFVNDAGSAPSVAPWGGVTPLLSTNPIAAGVPYTGHDPILIDISSALTARGKLLALQDAGEQAPEGYLIDQQQQSIREPERVLAREDPEGSILPLGGLLAGHKGFALGVLVDVLAGALTGAGCSSGSWQEHDNSGVFLIALAPEFFSSRKTFDQEISNYVTNLKGGKKAPGVEEIFYPGERAARERRRRAKEGIPLERGTWEKLRDMLSQFGREERYSITVDSLGAEHVQLR